jgi:hypothetical protein
VNFSLYGATYNFFPFPPHSIYRWVLIRKYFLKGFFSGINYCYLSNFFSHFSKVPEKSDMKTQMILAHFDKPLHFRLAVVLLHRALRHSSSFLCCLSFLSTFPVKVQALIHTYSTLYLPSLYLCTVYCTTMKCHKTHSNCPTSCQGEFYY